MESHLWNCFDGYVNGFLSNSSGIIWDLNYLFVDQRKMAKKIKSLATAGVGDAAAAIIATNLTIHKITTTTIDLNILD